MNKYTYSVPVGLENLSLVYGLILPDSIWISKQYFYVAYFISNEHCFRQSAETNCHVYVLIDCLNLEEQGKTRPVGLWSSGNST